MPSVRPLTVWMIFAGALLSACGGGGESAAGRTERACAAADLPAPDRSARLQAWADRCRADRGLERSSELDAHPVCEGLRTARLDVLDPLGPASLERLAQALRRAAERTRGELRRGLLIMAESMGSLAEGGTGLVDSADERRAEEAADWLSARCSWGPSPFDHSGREPPPEHAEICRRLERMSTARQRVDGAELDAEGRRALAEAIAAAPGEIRPALEWMRDNWDAVSEGRGPSPRRAYARIRPVATFVVAHC